MRSPSGWLLLSLLTMAGCAQAEAVRPSPAEVSRLERERRLEAVERSAEHILAQPSPRTRADSLARANALLDLLESRDIRRLAVDSLSLARAREASQLMEHLSHATPPMRARALETLGGVVNSLPGESDASLLRRAIALRESDPSGPDTLLALSYEHLGMLLRSERDTEGALDAFRRSYETRVTLHGAEHPASAEALSQLGSALDESGRYEEAVASVREALAVFDRLGAPLHPMRLLPLVWMSSLLGREQVSELLAVRHEALRVAEAGYGEGSIEYRNALANLGVALMDFGDFSGARVLLEKALPAFVGAFGVEAPGVNTLRQQLAIACFQSGDTAHARRLLLESERIVRKTGRGSLGTALRWQAELMLREDHPAEAADLAARAYAADSLNRGGPTWPLARSLMVRMQALEVLRDSSAMRATLARLLAHADADPLWRQGWLSNLAEYRSRTARMLGDAEGAWKWALEAERVSREGTRLQARSLPDTRALQLARQGTRYLEGVFGLADTPERRETAWDLLVRERGAVRTETRLRRLPAAWRGDSVRTSAHASWVAAQREMAAFLVQHASAALDSADAQRLDRLRTEAETTEAALGSLGSLAALDTRSASPTLAAVLAALRPGEALVGMFTLGASADSDRVFAYVARAGEAGVKRVELGHARAIEESIGPWIERLSTPPSSSASAARRAESATRQAGVRARSRCWDPLAGALEGARVVHLVPAGPVRDLVWAALPWGPEGYLGDAGPDIRVLESERELLEARDEPRGPATLLALGAPDFGRVRAADAAALREGADLCAAKRPVFLPLPATRAEVGEIASTWEAQGSGAARVLVGPEATESAFRELATGRAVLHLATHGFVAGDTCSRATAGLRGVGGVARVAAAPARRPRPAAVRFTPWMDRRVWLALADANRETPPLSGRDDGLLTAEEVVTLDLSGTDWVVLSACHSAFSARWSQEGALGMRRAFRLAGARSVIASHWAVADEATREWMEALYRARATGATDAAAAVRRASREVLASRRANGRSTHPFYWAAFTATGR